MSDVGPLGDVNLDGVVDQLDLQVVVANSGATGPLEIEDGDANLDGSVNATDADIVVENMDD